MKTIHALFAVATLMTLGGGLSTPAEAFPPTATVSPGYDRALAESRRQRGAGQPYAAAPDMRSSYAEPRYPRMKRHVRRY